MMEAIRDELRYCARKGLRPPARPDAETLWAATGGDGPAALLVALEFEVVAREVRQERAERRLDEWRLRAA